MSATLFSSEAFSEHERGRAWRDLLASVGVSTITSSRFAGHTTALSRSEADSVSLLRFAAAPQHFTPCSQSRGIQADGLPLAFVALSGDVHLKSGSEFFPVPGGGLVVLPQGAGWELASSSGMRGVFLAVAAGAFSGRLVRAPLCRNAIVLPRDGLTLILSRMIAEVADTLDDVTDAEWTIVRSSLAEMLLAALRTHEASTADGATTNPQAALLHRLCDAIERRLHEPDLSPARIARAEGISERYLQRVLEASGRNFSAYLRERRLQHCRSDLASAAETRFSVSEIAFRRGFNDAAHFSRSFRDRFGLSPRDFRQQQARLVEEALPAGQRGWPRDALSRAKTVIAPRPGTVVPLRPDLGSSKRPGRHVLPATATTVHWGYFSRTIPPRITIASGDTIVVETLSQHASDDAERMIAGDEGALDVFRWTATEKAVDRRGAGPMDASVFGRGAGEGIGVHICTGPIAVEGAEPGDVLEVRILDMVPRRSRSEMYAGRVFGSSVAAWWGYHYGELVSEPRKREVVTIYEIFDDVDAPHARAVHSYQWQPQLDPFGVLHQTYDYPGVPVAPGSVRKRHAVLDGVKIPLRPHFGVVAVAPRETDLVDSVPPSYFGGNLDNWRLGKGATVYLPVSVPGALLSVGDPHAAQGDGEVAGTAIECSMTGTLQVILHKRADLAGSFLTDVNYPLIETATAWIFTGFSYPNHLAEFGGKGQSEVYTKSSLDLALKDAFRKVRRFLMNTKELSEDEAIALISAAVDFGITQVVDGNWGVHATLEKTMFENAR